MGGSASGVRGQGAGRTWRGLAALAAVTAGLLGSLHTVKASVPRSAVIGWQPGVRAGAPPGAPLTVYFDHLMNPASVRAAWSLRPRASGALSWSGNALTFTPSPALRPATRYRLSITSVARSVQGLALSPFSATFTTGDRLRVTSMTPAGGTQGVPSSGRISLSFNHPMVPLVGPERSAGPPPGWRVQIHPAVAGHGAWLGTSTWVFYPDRGLAPSVHYTIILAGTARDQWGERLGRSLRWSFATATPEVFSRSPRNGSSFGDPRSPVVVTFDQAMDRASAQAAFHLTLHGARVPGTFRWSGNALQFFPSAPLGSSDTYRATIAASARSANREAALGRTQSWTFRVSPYPAVTGTSPAPGGTARAQGSAHDSGVCCYAYEAAFMFSAPMDKRSLDTRLTISPRVPQFQTDLEGPNSSGDFTYTISGNFAPSSSYTLSLRSGARDQFGRVAGAGRSFTFKTSELFPSVALYGMPGAGAISVSSGQAVTVPLQVLNVPTVHMVLERVNLWQLNQPAGPFGTVVRRWTEHLTVATNHVDNVRVHVTQKNGSDLTPGLYWVSATAPDSVRGWGIFDNTPPGSSALVAVTNVGVTMKAGGNGVLAWINSAVSGRGLNRVQVRLTNYIGQTIVSGATDSRGLRFFKGAYNVYAAVVNDGTHFGIALSNWAPNSVSPTFLPPLWTPPYSYTAPGTYAYTDRPVYRPGQTVHFRAVLWRDSDGVYSVPTGGRVAVQATDLNGHALFHAQSTLDRFGAVHGSFRLPSTVMTGNHAISFWLPHVVQTTATFTVAEYRKPEFLTHVSMARQDYAQGDRARAAVTVRYVFGAPAAHVHVQWTAYARPQVPRPRGWDAFAFVDWESLWQSDVVPQGDVQAPESQFGVQIATGSGRTDGGGRLVLQIPVDVIKRLTDQVVTLEATSTDVNHQAVSGRATFVEHPAQFSLGLAADLQTFPAGHSETVRIAAVRPGGGPVAGQSVNVTLSRRTYSTQLRVSGTRQSYWQPVPHDSAIESHSVVTDAHGQASFTFTPQKGGEYVISVKARDAHGNQARNSLSVYASSAGLSDWGTSESTSLALKPDKSSYRVGEMAHIAVPAPFADATVLVTVERGDIRRYWVQHLTGNSRTVSVPITLDSVPNVYVGVTLYRGWRNGSPPDWRSGISELHVAVDPRRLIVHLQQTAARRHPGDRVTYAIRTTDVSGRPVSAQVSLALVDVSVLALQDETAPDILQALYSDRDLGVSTASDGAVSIDHLQDKPNQRVQGLVGGGKGVDQAAFGAPHLAARAGGGGGGGFPQATIRSHFADTAYWLGAVATGGAGTATVSLRLPDNATTWRLDVRGLTDATQVGQSTLRTVATRDVVVRPMVPRFLVQGDHLTLGATVNNTLARPVRARVSLHITGAQVRGHPFLIVLPAHGERLVQWQVTVGTAHSAQVEVTARVLTAGVQSDAVRMSLPVHAPLTGETVATAGEVYGSVRQAVIVPEAAVSVPGSMMVRVSASLTAGLGSVLGQMRPETWESNDDVANRVLVAASLERVPQAITGLSPSAYRLLPATVAAGVQKLLGHQLPDGGWPWINDPAVYQSDVSVSADVLRALALAGEGGGQARSAIVRARTFVTNSLHSAVVSAQERPGLLRVLALVGSPVKSESESIDRNSVLRLHLAPPDLADLALALGSAGDARAAGSIIAQLDGAARVSATGAHWEGSGPTAFNATAVAATTEVLSALVQLDPRDPFVPAAARWLMLARQGDVWDCGHDSAQAVVALTAYARAAREGAAAYRYRVLINGRPRLVGAYTAYRQTSTPSVSLPVSRLLPSRTGSVTIRRQAANGSFGAGPLYYVMRLHYFLPADRIAARSEGVSVSRRFTDLKGHPLHAVRAGSPIKVELTVHTDQSLLYLTIQDPIPAGAEPIDESLNTSQRGLFGPAPWLPYWQVGDLSWYLQHADLRDDRVSLDVPYLPPGTYRYTYLLDATVPGRYDVAPTHAAETFFPEVFGRSQGQVLTVK